MRLLVTGGAGFIGRVLVRDLLACGHEITVLDDLSTGDRVGLPERVRLIVGDVLDPAAVDAALAGGVDAVLHLAALLIVDESFEQPDRYMRTNTEGTRILLNAMSAHGCDRLVFSSTAAVYGQASEGPIAEDAPLCPASPYGESKLRADRLIAERAKAGLHAVSLRYFNVSGASGGLGENRERETHLLPLALEVAAGESPVVRLYGTDYPTPDGTPIRDYVHVDDVSSAHVAALRATPLGHRVYNVGSGTGHSVREVLACVEKMTGRRVPTRVEPRRRGDPPVLVAANDRIRAEIGWSPHASSLQRIVRDAWSWKQRRAQRVSG